MNSRIHVTKRFRFGPDVHANIQVRRDPAAEHQASSPRHAWTVFDYRGYAAFSWDWSWRRCVLFASFGLVFGVWEGLIITAIFGNWHVGFAMSLAAAGPMIVAMCAGPLAASWIRSRRWPMAREMIGVIAAVIVGITAANACHWLANKYAVVPQASVMRFVAANYPGRLRAFGDSPLPLLSRVVEFLLLGGSLALPSYFAGLRRAIEEAREHEVSELQLLKQETDLRLLVLQAQIEPHFLFNTLASLRSLLRQDVDRAEAMIDALVEHLRAAMPIFRENQQHSALSEQLRICSSYLELMQVRLADRLTYTIVVAEPLRSAAFPPLILLTLVENAVKHGIEPKPGPGHIRIEVTRSPRVDGTHIIVSVTDNGAGLSAGLGHGVGLSNIRAQLALKYGDRATLSLMSNADGGAVASVDIPESDVNESPCAQLTRRLS
jgi:signal transduction histidine kinase